MAVVRPGPGTGLWHWRAPVESYNFYQDQFLIGALHDEILAIVD